MGFWWNASKENVGNEICTYLQTLSNKQADITQMNLRNFRLYGNNEILGLRNTDYYRVKNLNRLTLNVIKMAIDTLTSKIAKYRPRPRFLTDNGDYSMQRKAENLQKYIDGVFYQTNAYSIGEKAFTHAGVFGTSAVKTYVADGKTKLENVFIEEIKVDQDECMYGEPIQMHQVKAVHKEKLKISYPKFANQIEKSTSLFDNFMKSVVDNNQIDVIESWKLPLGNKDKGRHVICTSSCVMVDEPWEVEWFPFEFFKYEERLLGFFGQGISEILTGSQIEINRLLKRAQLSMHLMSVPRVFIEDGSKIISTHINNDIGSIITFQGTPPIFDNQDKVPREIFEQIQVQYTRSFEQVGISFLSATSQKPAGLNSGKALREYTDIETDRFAVTSRRWEDFYMRLAKKCMLLAKQNADADNDFEVLAGYKNGIDKIKWKEVELPEDSFIMKVQPSSILPTTPFGKVEAILEYSQSGFFSKAELMDLFEFPDLERKIQIETAPLKNLERVVQLMVDKGIYTAPEPFDDLAYGIKFMQHCYAYYKNWDLPSDKLELITRWMDDALVLTNPAQQIESTMTDDMLEQSIPTDDQMTLAMNQQGAQSGI